MTKKKRLRTENHKKESIVATKAPPVTTDDLKQYLQDQLFNNEMVKKAKENMTPKQLEEYKKKGEEFFADVNFEDKNGNTVPPVESACAYISEGLKAGMHPSYLDDDEKRVMVEMFGKEWYKKWGWDSLEF
jgi:hypothetical protein